MESRNQGGNGANPSDWSNGDADSDSEAAVRFDGGDPEDSGNAGGATEDSGNAGGGTEDSGNDGARRAADGGSEEPNGPETDETSENRIFHRKVTPEAEEANESLLRLIANLERCEVTDLPPLYDQIDNMVEHLFTEPPPTDAQAELEFTYHGYRIELDQSGDVKFMKVSEDAPSASEE